MFYMMAAKGAPDNSVPIEDRTQEGKFSSSVIFCAILSIPSGALSLWRGIVTYKGTHGNVLPSYKWHRDGFFYHVFCLVLVTCSLWPGTIVFLFHSKGVSLFDLILVSVTDETRKVIYFHGTIFASLCFLDTVCFYIATVNILKFTSMASGTEDGDSAQDRPEGNEDDEDDDEEEDVYVKIKPLHKVTYLALLVANFMYFIDLVLIDVESLNSGLIVATVVAFFLAVWTLRFLPKFLKKSYKLAWLNEFRTGLLIHFVVMFVIFWASLAILLLLRALDGSEFVSTVLSLPGLRGLAVVSNLFLFFLVALAYLFLLGYQSRGMWLADEIASLQLMERMMKAAEGDAEN